MLHAAYMSFMNLLSFHKCHHEARKTILVVWVNSRHHDLDNLHAVKYALLVAFYIARFVPFLYTIGFHAGERRAATKNPTRTPVHLPSSIKGMPRLNMKVTTPEDPSNSENADCLFAPLRSRRKGCRRQPHSAARRRKRYPVGEQAGRRFRSSYMTKHPAMVGEHCMEINGALSFFCFELLSFVSHP